VNYVLDIQKLASARLPATAGKFQMSAYHNGVDGKDHIALTIGDIRDGEEVLVRVHSECLTGDVFGSQRCDCGPQLEESLRIIGQAGRGALLYLRQEGRGIGLVEKMKAYNLQDQGYDTLDANLALGHPADGREYSTAARILEELGIRSVILLTNNPLKIEGLRSWGIPVVGRQPVQVGLHPENTSYLQTKQERMQHLLNFESFTPAPQAGPSVSSDESYEQLKSLQQWLLQQPSHSNRPVVTLSYAQSLDGSIALNRRQPLGLSGPESMLLTHHLRSWHDAIMVGVGTVLADDPQLNVRLVTGPSPRPIILDPQLRTPAKARLWDVPGRECPIFVAAPDVEQSKIDAINDRGGEVLLSPVLADASFDLAWVLGQVGPLKSIMVEGGSTVLRHFIRQKAADRALVTVVPRWIQGVNPILQGQEALVYPTFQNPNWQQWGEDSIVYSDLQWPTTA
jgi:GTP cyclohydrolase II